MIYAEAEQVHFELIGELIDSPTQTIAETSRQLETWTLDTTPDRVAYLRLTHQDYGRVAAEDVQLPIDKSKVLFAMGRLSQRLQRLNLENDPAEKLAAEQNLVKRTSEENRENDLSYGGEGIEKQLKQPGQLPNVRKQARSVEAVPYAERVAQTEVLPTASPAALRAVLERADSEPTVENDTLD